MSQQQLPRPPSKDSGTEPIKYGDVFPVTGDLAGEPIAPRDAASMQAAENSVLGRTQRRGPAATMQSAAARNQQAGLVSGDDSTVGGNAGKEGVTVEEIDLPGRRVITESIAGQVVGLYVGPEPVHMNSPALALDRDAVTIGQALESCALTAGDKTVDQSDAAAIQAAEMRAAGRNTTVPGGIGAAAQSAATANSKIMLDSEKTKVGEILSGATGRMAGDKAATKVDAEGVVEAELRNSPRMETTPGGVAASVAEAARLNQEQQLRR